MHAPRLNAASEPNPRRQTRSLVLSLPAASDPHPQHAIRSRTASQGTGSACLPPKPASSSSTRRAHDICLPTALDPPPYASALRIWNQQGLEPKARAGSSPVPRRREAIANLEIASRRRYSALLLQLQSRRPLLYSWPVASRIGQLRIGRLAVVTNRRVTSYT
jgi:hypothetical protein